MTSYRKMSKQLIELNKPISFPFSDTEGSDGESPQKVSFDQRDSDEEEGVRAEDNQRVARGELELERPIYTGYLKKKGEQRRSWKKRFFVLRATKICYYKDDKVHWILVAYLTPFRRFDLTLLQG